MLQYEENAWVSNHYIYLPFAYQYQSSKYMHVFAYTLADSANVMQI